MPSGRRAGAAGTPVSSAPAPCAVAAAFSLYAAAVQARAPQLAAALDCYVAELGAGPIGMVLELDGDGAAVVVAELRRDAAGRPLQALATGLIAQGDELLAVNGAPLERAAGGALGALEAVASAFKATPRPITLLFRRRRPPRAAAEPDTPPERAVAVGSRAGGSTLAEHRHWQEPPQAALASPRERPPHGESAAPALALAGAPARAGAKA